MVATAFFSGSVYADKIEKCETDQCVKYFKQYKKGAKRGHAQAMLTLAQFYHAGYGTEVDTKKALKYFKKAASHGYTAAHFNAGYIQMIDQNLRDIDDSVKYLNTASKYNYKGAEFLLGMIHFDEQYGRKNFAKADAHFAKAFKNKHDQMPNVVQYMQSKNMLDGNQFPKLNALVNKKPLVKKKDGSMSFHGDNVEVITITGAPLTELFDEQLLTFRKKVKATGTRFGGKSCAERLTCMQRADIADSTDYHNLFLNGFSGAVVSSQ